MNAGAWIMFFVGALGLWGGVALSLWNYLRRSKQERATGDRAG